MRGMQVPNVVIQAIDPFDMFEQSNQTKSKEENHIFGSEEFFFQRRAKQHFILVANISKIYVHSITLDDGIKPLIHI